MLKRINRIVLAIATIGALVIPLGHTYSLSASQLAAQNDTVGTCDSGNDHSTFIDNFSPLSGTVYAQLSNKSENPGAVTIYFQSLTDYSCEKVGQPTSVNTNSWTLVGNYKISDGQSAALVASGDNLQGQPYAALIKLLIVPDQSLCNPLNCIIKYQGQDGLLSPKIISSATDEVAAYRLDPIDGLTPTRVDYYDNGTFIYSSKKIEDVNKNYLPGGKQTITATAFFNNNEQFTVTSNIDMGPDYTYTQYLKSQYYRSHNKALFVAVVGGIVGLVVGAMWLIRYIYKKRKFIKDHGLDENHYSPDEVDDSEDDVVVGG